MDGWYFVHTSDANGAASAGLVPRDYVALTGAPHAGPPPQPTALPPPVAPASDDPKRPVKLGIMQADFEGETPEELSVTLGTRVFVDYDVSLKLPLSLTSTPTATARALLNGAPHVSKREVQGASEGRERSHMQTILT